MKYKLEELIDIPMFQSLQDRLNEIYSFPSAIIDNDGNVLTATAWQDICIKFHRLNKESEKECIKSDKYILEHIHEANPAVSYKCPHGLVDNATPIIIEGVHYGNFFTGQFFLNEPDLEFFKEQAKKYGFDEVSYLEAVKKVPIWTQTQLDNYLFFIKGLIEVISGIGLKNLKEIEANEKIKESEEKYRRLVEQTHDGIIQVDNEDVIQFVNQRFCELLGYQESKILGKVGYETFIFAEDKELIQEKNRTRKKGTNEQYELRMKKKNGEAIYFLMSASPILNQEGEVIGSMSICTDITERKLAEEALRESEEKYRFAMEATNDGLWDWDVAKNRVFYSDSWKEILGYDNMEPVYDSWEALIHPDDKQSVLESLKNHLAGHTEKWQIEHRLKASDCSWKWVLGRGRVKVRDSKGTPLRVVGTMTDISERKQVDQNLIQNQYYLSKAQELGSIGTWELDLIKNKLIWTEQNYINFGIQSGTPLTYEIFFECIHPDDKVYVNKEWMAAIDGKPYDIEHRLIVDGKVRWVREKADIDFDNNHKAIRAIGFTQDITKQKLVEEALIESEKKYKTIIEAAPFGMHMYHLNPDGGLVFTDSNPAADTILGVINSQFKGKTIEEAFPPLIDTEVPEKYRKVAEKGIPWNSEQIDYEDGKIKGAFLVRAFQTSPKKMIAMFMDITERKRVETSLKESEEKYRLLHENAGLGVGYYQTDGTVISYNKVAAEHMNGNPEDFQGKSIFDLFPKEVSHEYYKRITRAISVDITEEYIDEVELPNSKKWFISTYNKIKDANNNILGIQIMSQDISEIKNAELSLKESTEKYQKVVENIHEAFIIEDVQGNLIFANDEFFRLFGYNENEIRNLTLTDYTAPESREEVIQRHNKRMAGEDVETEFEYRGLRKDGTKIWIEAKVTLIKENDKIIGTQSFERDITERKKAEKAIKASEEKYRQLIELSPDGIIVHKNGTIIFANDASAKLSGYSSAEELVGKNAIEFVHPDYREKAIERIRNIITNNMKAPLAEEKFMRKDGSVFDVEVTAIPYVIGNETAVQVIIRDISERKEAEETIKYLFERYDLAISAAELGVWDRIIEDDILIWNDKMFEIFGIARDDFGNTYKEWLKFIHPDDKDKVLKEINLALSGEKDYNVSYRIKTPSGITKYIKGYGRVSMSEGEPIRMTGINFDITEQKLAEEKINEQLHELQRWYDVTSGREERIIQIKKEVNELKKRLGEPPAYLSVE